jgi:CHAT domain-containing protein/tetratricopeptide (TPR) repeat protein
MRLAFFLLLITSHMVLAQNSISQADSLLLDGKGEEAIKLLNEDLKETPTNDKPFLQLKIAESWLSLQQYDKAQALIEVVKQGSTTELLMADIKLVEGYLLLYQGKNEQAIKVFEQAEQLFTQLRLGSELVMAKTLTGLGLAYYNDAKLKQAEEQLLMALLIRSRLLPANHELMAASYNDLGLIYSQSDVDKALTYYEKALPIYLALHGKDHAKIAINNTNTGVIYANLELFGDAINNLEEALRVWNAVIKTPSPRKAFVLFQLGYTYQQMKDNNNAEVYYKRALDEYKNSYGEKHPDIASVLNALGNLERLKENYPQALGYFHHALISNLKNYSNPDIYNIPQTNEYYNGKYLLYSMMYKAQTFEARYFGKTLKFSDLKAGLQHLLACDSLIDNLRQQSNNEADKITLGAIANEVYADAVRMSVTMSEVAFGNRDNYRATAFYFSEKSKSAVLLEAIADVNAKSFAGIPANLLEEEENIKSAITLSTQKLAQKPTAEEEAYLRESLYTLNKQYQDFTKSLEQQYPDYYNLKFNTKTPSANDLQKITDGQTALLSYFIDDSKVNNTARLYIFIVTQNKLSIVWHSLTSDFNKYLTGFRNSLYYNESKTLHTVAHKLYKLLIPTLPKNINSLVIFPTGRLGVIPFEALISKAVKEITSSPAYLIKQYAVRYEFSASLALQKTSADKKAIQSILLFAPITFSEVDNLDPLPGTQEEVNNIGTLFNQASAKATIVVNKEASEERIKSGELEKFDMLHFATHGIVDESDPELSKIFLKAGHSEDGYLYSGEIYNLKLNAQLVTLSACQTGLGKIAKGEGVIGLSRALIYAGAKNIMVSFWSVADESTALLMKDFYAHTLQTKSSFAKSLQQVKINMLNSKSYNSPYYWAPFVLIGF